MGTKPIVVDGWMDLRTERIDSTVGWMIGCLVASLLSSFDIVDMEAELFLMYSGDDVSSGDGR